MKGTIGDINNSTHDGMDHPESAEWTVERIQEADYGCEERPEGEKLKVLVTLTDGTGKRQRILVEDDWLYENGIDEGSAWPAGDTG